MEQNAPVESGIAAFLNNFGSTVAKGSQNQQKEAGKQALEAYKANAKQKLAEDPNKKKAIDTQLSEKAKLGIGGKNDPQLALARRTLQPINKIENDLVTYGNNLKNPMYATANPLAVEHYRQYLKDGLAQHKTSDEAINYAIQKSFKDAFPDKAAALYKAHSSGTVAHVLQNYPQLVKEFPVISQKYQVTNPEPEQVPIQPQPSNPTPIQPQPKQVSMIPELQQQFKMPPIQLAQGPKEPTMAGQGNGPIAPPNTMIPGQGPSQGQEEEALDNTPTV